jgi:hypothetical protein
MTDIGRDTLAFAVIYEIKERERERERECVCVCERERERESGENVFW